MIDFEIMHSLNAAHGIDVRDVPCAVHTSWSTHAHKTCLLESVICAPSGSHRLLKKYNRVVFFVMLCVNQSQHKKGIMK